MRRNQMDFIYLLSFFSSLLVLFYIIFPIFNTITWTKGDLLLQTLKDRQAMGSIYLSITAANADHHYFPWFWEYPLLIC